jgi:hypothetical protein
MTATKTIRQRITTRNGFRNVGGNGGVMTVEPGAQRVDREKGIIYGASAMQAVEALGHDVLVDQKTLEQVRDLGNASALGIKSRFTHPGMCSDGMGKMLGRQRNFRIEGDKVVGDLHLMDAAAKAPDGDLRSYVLDLAEQDPGAFGMSVVISMHSVWKLQSGREIRTDDASLRRGHGDDAYYAKPDAATTDTPFCRIDALHACDVVDEPAANRDGLFSAAFSGTTSLDSAAAFAAIDEVRERLGMGADDLTAFLGRYLASRSLTTTRGHLGQGGSMKISAERLAQLCEQHPAHAVPITKLAAAGHDEPAILAEVAKLESAQVHADLTAKLEAATKALSDASAAHAVALKAEQDKVAELSAKLNDITAKHDALAKIGGSAPKDPGGSPTPSSQEKDPLSEANLKARWEADQKLREGFAGDFEALKALARDDKPYAMQALGLSA